MNRYHDNKFDRDVVTIYPGEYYVSKGPEYISTILGSCVSIILVDTENKIGGMNHFMLAKSDDAKKNREMQGPITRFGEFAIEALIKEMEKKGAVRKNLKSKIFGGSNVFNFKDRVSKQVGNVNISFAKEVLTKLDIPILAEDTGGISSRKIIFDPVTFKVLVKKIKNKKD